MSTSCTCAIATLCCVVTLPACGGGDEFDRIEATISNANATVEPVDMDHGLSGSVDLDLTLGPDAEAGAYGVRIDFLFIKVADASPAVFQSLKTTTEPAPPLNVGRGADLQLTVNFAAVDNVMEPEDMVDFCEAMDGVELEVDVGSPGIDESRLTSERFTLEGCP